jgi:CheY-like chemotaxis protein
MASEDVEGWRVAPPMFVCSMCRLMSRDHCRCQAEKLLVELSGFLDVAFASRRALKTMSLAMVIEDEPEIATFASAVFKRYGLETITVESAPEAIEMMQGVRDISVLLLNMTRGREQLELARLIAARWPAVQIILMSSHLDSLRDLPPVVFLAKPTTSTALIAMIRRVISAPPNSPMGGDPGDAIH